MTQAKIHSYKTVGESQTAFETFTNKKIDTLKYMQFCFKYGGFENIEDGIKNKSNKLISLWNDERN